MRSTSESEPGACSVELPSKFQMGRSSTDEGFLSLTAGDVMVVTVQDDGGWWTGYSQKSPELSGMFPSTYVELVVAEGGETEAVGEAAAGHGEAGQAPASEAGAEAQGEEAAVSGEQAALVTASVLYDYETTDEGFLSLTAGDVMVPTSRDRVNQCKLP